MDVTQAVELGRGAIVLSLTLATPVLAIAVLVGLLISIFQAVTQLQDQTLSFVPKIVAMMVTLLYILPWLMAQMMEYSVDLFEGIPVFM